MARMWTEGSVGLFFPIFSSLVRHKLSLFRKTWSSNLARWEMNKWELNEQQFNLTKRTFSPHVPSPGKQLCAERRKPNQLDALSIQAICWKLFFYWFFCPAAYFQNMWPAGLSVANNICLCLLKHSHTPGLLAAPPVCHTPWRTDVSMPGTKRWEVLFRNSKHICSSTGKWERTEKLRVKCGGIISFTVLIFSLPWL